MVSHVAQLALRLHILKKAAKHSAALASALDVWGDITFDFQSTDTLDTVETPTASR